MFEKDLVKELRVSLPSTKMLEVVRNGAIQIYGELIFLKKVDEDPTDFIKWEENKGYGHHYYEIQGKNVVFGHTLFNKRGQEAIEKYLQTPAWEG